jgi:hypothetical protein
MSKKAHSVKVELREIVGKGRGIIATDLIKKGEKIAYYKAKVYNRSTYESPTDSVYLFEVYKKNGQPYKRLIADIYEGSVLPPKNGITYLAPFSNEPGPGQTSNADIDLNFKGNYDEMKRNKLKAGDTIVYFLYALRDINAGEEIVWYYGPDYTRDYQVGDLGGLPLPPAPKGLPLPPTSKGSSSKNLPLPSGSKGLPLPSGPKTLPSVTSLLSNLHVSSLPKGLPLPPQRKVAPPLPHT